MPLIHKKNPEINFQDYIILFRELSFEFSELGGSGFFIDLYKKLIPDITAWDRLIKLTF